MAERRHQRRQTFLRVTDLPVGRYTVLHFRRIRMLDGEPVLEVYLIDHFIHLPIGTFGGALSDDLLRSMHECRRTAEFIMIRKDSNIKSIVGLDIIALRENANGYLFIASTGAPFRTHPPISFYRC